RPLSTFAMGLIAVSIGGHLSYRRIHNALRRIISIAAGEILLTFALVGLAMYLMTESWILAVLFASLSIDTAPGTTVALIRENRAKGTFVKALLSVVAIDNIIAIALFATISSILSGYFMQEDATGQNLNFGYPVFIVLGSIAMGLAIGFGMEKLLRRPQFHNF